MCALLNAFLVLHYEDQLWCFLLQRYRCACSVCCQSKSTRGNNNERRPWKYYSCWRWWVRYVIIACCTYWLFSLSVLSADDWWDYHLNIGQHLAKLWARVECPAFLTHGIPPSPQYYHSGSNYCSFRPSSSITIIFTFPMVIVQNFYCYCGKYCGYGSTTVPLVTLVCSNDWLRSNVSSHLLSWPTRDFLKKEQCDVWFKTWLFLVPAHPGFPEVQATKRMQRYVFDAKNWTVGAAFSQLYGTHKKVPHALSCSCKLWFAWLNCMPFVHWKADDLRWSAFVSFLQNGWMHLVSIYHMLCRWYGIWWEFSHDSRCEPRWLAVQKYRWCVLLSDGRRNWLSGRWHSRWWSANGGGLWWWSTDSPGRWFCIWRWWLRYAEASSVGICQFFVTWRRKYARIIGVPDLSNVETAC